MVIVMLYEEKHSKSNYRTALHYHNMKTIPHCQSTLEILFVSSGTVRATRQRESILLFPGQCLWLMPFEVHAYETIEDNDVSVFIFSGDMMPDFVQTLRSRTLRNPVSTFTEEDLEQLCAPGADAFMLKSILYKIASAVYGAGTEPLESPSDAQALSKCMLFIQEHYRENLTLRDLARHLGYSYHYTSHLFRSNFSCGFCEMVNMHRLEEAVRLLRSGDLNMTQISELAGFPTIRNFNLVFKNHYHMSPSDFLRTHQSEPDQK